MFAMLIILIPSAAGLAGWISYLLFCRSLVKRSNDPASLVYAAMMARAYREGWPGQVAGAVATALWRTKTPR